MNGCWLNASFTQKGRLAEFSSTIDLSWMSRSAIVRTAAALIAVSLEKCLSDVIDNLIIFT